MSTPPVPPRPTAKALNCPSCGAALVLRSMDRAVTVVCDHCHAILDAKDPNLKVLETFSEKLTDKPLIPLGSRGTFRGTEYEVIGFQRRTIQVEGTDYSWHEYLLFNPFKGFRYLVEYDGHWNDVSPTKGLPAVRGSSAEYLGKKYSLFQTSDAHTTFVLGEFPWQVRFNDAAQCNDYVNPPFMLSCEQTSEETTWSLGEYIPGSLVWSSFKLPGAPPAAVGVYENQPSPLGTSWRGVWKSFGLLMLAMIVLFIANVGMGASEKVFTQNYVFTQPKPGQEASFVTPTFELKGRISDVEVKTKSNINNEWIYLNYALIDDVNGQAYDFGREVSYYHGSDSDGSWTEGSNEDSVIVPSVPAGHYYLRVEPESEANFGPIQYTVTVTRDVPVMSLYGWAFLALLVPAVFISWKAFNFEQMRWAESDYQPAAAAMGMHVKGGGDE
ncbi:conserved hypothetical protein [Candidatus Koribacter versatilis Ellin345]|uniref:DUF4178 domain-containing protein n=1 Tax=Koribacter versatilis (strain Ellin345) TaxID=204669 RepID=Q1IVI7_KORVE|nr:DUF4178 domain-containing protein [Candidatus Koribacter versatilis]ABF39113.1 conserved hypothetical protein [Candidatus Koribacter versatilis Ellin345]